MHLVERQGHIEIETPLLVWLFLGSSRRGIGLRGGGGSVWAAPSVRGSSSPPKPNATQKPVREDLRDEFVVKIMVNLLFKRGTCPAPLAPRSAAARRLRKERHGFEQGRGVSGCGRRQNGDDAEHRSILPRLLATAAAPTRRRDATSTGQERETPVGESSDRRAAGGPVRGPAACPAARSPSGATSPPAAAGAAKSPKPTTSAKSGPTRKRPADNDAAPGGRRAVALAPAPLRRRAAL